MRGISKQPAWLSLLIRTIILTVLILAILTQISSLIFKAKAALLDDRSLTLSNGTSGTQNVTYLFQFTYGSVTDVGSVLFEFCTNDPFPLTACTPPSGMDAAAATLASQTGETGFTIDTATANTILMNRIISPTGLTPSSYEFEGIDNPDVSATYYVRVYTYETLNGSGPPTDVAGIAWATSEGVSVTTEVPPNLEFCVALTIPALDCSGASGNFINFGNLSPSATSASTSQFLVFSNAGFGFTVSVYGTTMSSGVYEIPALETQSFSAPGTSQFGLNLRDNTLPNLGADPVGPGTAAVDINYDTPDLYRFVSGDAAVSSPGVSDYRKFTTTYITNVSNGQRPGRYATTVNYIALANF